MSRLAMIPAAAALALALGGCTGGCSRAPENPNAVPPEKANTVADRMRDPQYLKQLDKVRAEQTGIMKRTAEVQAALEKAKAADPESEEVKRLEAELEDCAKKMDESRRGAQVLVRAKIDSATAEQRTADASKVKAT